MAGVATVVVVACLGLAGLVITGTLLSDLGTNRPRICDSRTPPKEVRESSTGEGPRGVASASVVPFGARCTWTLPDGRSVSADPSWDSTLVIAGAAGVAVAAVGSVVWCARRTARTERRQS